mgnify:CR=1 FL=1
MEFDKKCYPFDTDLRRSTTLLLSQNNMARLDVNALLNVAPESFDPEDEYRNDVDSSDEEPRENDENMSEKAARQHYVDVGPSQMRRKARLTESDVLDKPQYQSVKASRAEMFGDDMDGSNGEEVDDDGDDEKNLDDDEELYDNSREDAKGEDTEEDEEDDDDENQDISISMDGDQVEEEEDEEDEEDVQEENSVLHSASKDGSKRAKHQHVDAAATVAMQEQESLSLMEQIREKRAQDAKKGQDVRKQIKNWEKTLRLRISFQKILTTVSRLPPPVLLSEYFEETPNARDEIDAAAAELEDIATQMLELRLYLWKQNFSSMSDDLSKHVRVDASASKALEDLEHVLEPHINTLLTRWSNKISSAPHSRNSSSSSRLQLRAMNQNVVDQIRQALAGDGMDRLVQRTQVWRADDMDRLGVIATASQESRPTDTEVFDDSDFYAQLLRDLIDNAGIMETGASNAASDALMSRKRKRNVDVRASKGRRLRYEVMEKVQNFMPPIPRVTWDDAQTERLFSQLASTTTASTDTKEPESDEPTWSENDGFRLLG